jgi:hypothetical protein
LAEGLTPEQHRAADLIGRNWPLKDVAGEIDVSERTLSRWKGDPAFAAAVKECRDKLLGEMPNAKATLEAALSATNAKGDPDWSTRVKAAQLLLTSAGAVPPPNPDERPTIIFMTGDDDAE